jgi:glc operon protein GlcG
MQKLFIVCVMAIAAASVNAQTGAQQSQSAPPAPPLVIPEYGEPITLARAQKVMAAAEAEAKRLKVSPTFAILDSTGHLVMFEKLDNSDYGNGEIAIAMARSSVEFRRPTKEFADAVTRNPAEAFLVGVVPFQGGWPLLVNGRLVGAIGFTGARGGQPENGKAPGTLISEAAINAAK